MPAQNESGSLGYEGWDAGHEPMTDAELEVFFFKVYFSFSLLFMILVLRKKYTI